LEVVVHLAADLAKVLVHVRVSILKSLFSKLSDLSMHHAVLVSEKAVGSAEEAFEGDHLLQEAKFRVGLSLLLRFNGLLDRGVDLVVNFSSRKSGKS